MKLIKLTKGKFAVVDDCFFDYLNQWRWHASVGSSGVVYAARRHHETKKIVLMHRVIIRKFPAGKKMYVDHIDHDGLNNQVSNLRVCTNQENSRNQKKRKKTSSRFKGVCWAKASGKWHAQIKLNDKRIHLGYYNDEIEAAQAYDVAAKH